MSPNLNYDFVEPQFKDAFFLWITHKKEIKKGYKTQRSIEICYKHLKALAGSPENALTIVEQSIANNWQGLFPLKNKPYESVANRTTAGINSTLASLAADINFIAASGSHYYPT